MQSQQHVIGLGTKLFTGATEENERTNTQEQGAFGCPRNLLLFFHYLKRDSFVLSCFAERVCQKENVIHTNTKSKKRQNLQ